MPGDNILLERQKSQITESGHYDYHINNLQSQVDFKQFHLNNLNEAQSKLDEKSKKIDQETQYNQDLMNHQWNKIVIEFKKEPAQVAKQLKIAAEDDAGEYEIINEAQSFASTLKKSPQLATTFNSYLATIKSINICFNSMTETDAWFINPDIPNEKIRDLNVHKEKLEIIVKNLEAIKGNIPESSSGFVYVSVVLEASSAALEYVDKFFRYRQKIADTRTRLANETVTNIGLREKLGETRKILEFQTNELKHQMAAALIKQTGKENRRRQEDNNENTISHTEKKNPPSSHQPSSSATSFTTLHLAPHSRNIIQEPQLVTQTKQALADLNVQISGGKRLKN